MRGGAERSARDSARGNRPSRRRRAARRRLLSSVPPFFSAGRPPRCLMFGLEKPPGQQKLGRSGGFPNMASVGDFNVLSSSIPATKVELSVSCR